MKRALISAVEQGRVDIVEVLIKNGADIERSEALNVAMIYSEVSVVASLLNHGAIIHNFEQVFNFLKQKKVKFNSEDVPDVLMALTKLCEQFGIFLKDKIPTEKELELQEEINVYLYEVNSFATGFRKNIYQVLKEGKSAHPFQDLTGIISDYLGVSTPPKQIYEPSCAAFFKHGEDFCLLFKHVVRGELKKVEEIIKTRPKLLLMEGKLTRPDTDYVIFKNITVFQYALWSLNEEMWTLLLRYLSHEQAADQFKEFDNQRKPINLLPLIDSLKIFIDYFDIWNEKQKSDYWFEYKIPQDLSQNTCAKFYPSLCYNPKSYPPKYLVQIHLEVLLDSYKKGHDALDKLRAQLIPPRTYYGNGGAGVFGMG